MQSQRAILHVGIDPGVHVGFATSQNKKLLQLRTLDFWAAVAELEQLAQLYALHVYIEDPNANRPTFYKAGADNAKKREKISQNVGANKRDAILLIEKAELLGVKVVAIPPRKSKLTAVGFQQLTGWQTVCSQHARDAALLVFGR